MTAHRTPIVVTVLIAALCAVAAVRQSADRPAATASVLPARTADFNALYGENCAGCHGTNATGGAARGLVDPVFLRIADDTVIRDVVARGVPRTAMPAFARTAGGSLGDDRIDAIVRGLRSHVAGAGPGDLDPPPYARSASGDATRGGDTFATFCARCHGADGRGGSMASSIVDPAYLALVSDQSLRTTVIAGRPDLNAPNWRGNIAGRPMSAQEVSNVVAWLAAHRATGD